MDSKIKGYAATLASAIIFGCVPLCSKLIYAQGMTPISLIAFRSLLSCPMFIIALLITGEKISVSKKDLPKILLLSLFGIILTPLLLFTSYQFMSSGTSTVFHYVYPAAVIVGTALIYKEKIDKKSLFCVLLCTCGIACFYSPSESISLKGAILALSSGLTYAAYVIFLSKNKISGISRFKLSLYMFGFGGIVMFPISVITKTFVAPPNLKTWLLCVLFAFLACFLAYLFFQVGAQTIGGGKASILSTFEPITSLVVGYLVFNEKTSPLSILGAALVIVSSILIAYFDMKKSHS